MHERRPVPRGAWIGLLLAILAGTALRLAWGADIEFKYDEHWLFEHALVTGPGAFPWLGMRSSVGILNPGMSAWVFVALARLTGATSPVELARAVQTANILALVIVALFALTAVEPREREPWFWGIALGAVNPMSVVLARKIWQQSVLPVFTAAALVGWWNRDKPWGAVFWGVVGACIGQVHLAGFFLTGAFALWAFLFDRQSVRWRWWAAGTLAGLAPLVPWLLYVLGEAPARSQEWFAISRLVQVQYWIFWIVEPLGVGLWHSIGVHFREFLSGGPWHAVAILHIAALALGAVLYSVLVGRWRGDRWSRFPIGADQTAFTTNALAVGCGVLMTVSMLPLYRSYMNMTFPLEFVWLAHMTVGGDRREDLKRIARMALAGLWVVELLIAVSFLQYIHVHGGAPGADYGVAYGAQPPGQTFQP